MRTTFTDLVGTVHPLVGFNRSPAVVAEVSRAGGLGVLAATAYTPDELDAQLHWIEARADGAPYGVDLLVPVADVDAETARDRAGQVRGQLPAAHVAFVRTLLESYGIDAGEVGRGVGRGAATAAAISDDGVADLLDVTFDHDVALVANALGPAPEHLVARAHERGVAVAALVGSAAHAQRQLAVGVDVLVAQGTEAGGHTGTVATMVLTPEIVALAGDRPVLAAGGIATGHQLAAALALGAAGAWCGSVWLNTVEDITPPVVKAKLSAAGSGDTVRSWTRTGKPARQLRSAWHDAWDRSEAPAPLPMPQQVVLAKDAWALIDEAAARGEPGALELESFFVGQVVGGFGPLRRTEDVATAMVADGEARLRELAARLD